MNLTAELQKLADLHQAGQLTAEEFTEAKRRLLQQGTDAASGPGNIRSTDAEEGTRVAEKSYRSSRWSAGNFFFRDRLTLASDGMLFRKGSLLGSNEERIQYRAVASIKLKKGIFLSDLCIETSGGSQPIFINGLWKSEAREIQDTIRGFQRGA